MWRSKGLILYLLSRSATLKSGGCYMFSNLRGCDGQRVYFNGCSCIALNGQMVARYKDYKVEVIFFYSDLVLYTKNRMFKTGFWVQIKILYLCSCVVNSKMIFCSQKLMWNVLIKAYFLYNKSFFDLILTILEQDSLV